MAELNLTAWTRVDLEQEVQRLREQLDDLRAERAERQELFWQATRRLRAVAAAARLNVEAHGVDVARQAFLDALAALEDADG